MKFHLKSLSPVSQLSCLVFISGFSALVLEVIYVKLLRYWAGNTAYAVAAVLCAYMAGVSLGAFAGGKWLVGTESFITIYGGRSSVMCALYVRLVRRVDGLSA